ncbi:hypothetical protein Gotur_030781 [Gossypium turneri]
MTGTNGTFSFSSGTNNGGKAMKKVWLREDDPLDDTGDTMESNPTRESRSFKDQLMENGQESKGNGMAVGKDDIVLTEGDFTISEIDGVPSIKIGLNALYNRVYALGKPEQPIHLMDIDNDYVKINNHQEGDKLKYHSEGGIAVSKLGSRDTPGSVEIKRIEASYNDIAILSNGYCDIETS